MSHILVYYILEYACPAWHTSLTKEQSMQIERIQKRAFRIIFSRNCLDYENFCYIHKLETLEARRTNLCKSFFEDSVLIDSSCLHYLLPPHRVDHCYPLRRQKKLEPAMTRTARFSNSFIVYALNNYQK